MWSTEDAAALRALDVTRIRIPAAHQLTGGDFLRGRRNYRIRDLAVPRRWQAQLEFMPRRWRAARSVPR